MNFRGVWVASGTGVIVASGGVRPIVLVIWMLLRVGLRRSGVKVGCLGVSGVSFHEGGLALRRSRWVSSVLPAFRILGSDGKPPRKRGGTGKK